MNDPPEMVHRSTTWRLIYEKSQRYKELFSQYKNMTDEELLKFVNSGEEYQQIAKEVANDILKSDRSEYYQNIQESKRKEVERQKKLN